MYERKITASIAHCLWKHTAKWLQDNLQLILIYLKKLSKFEYQKKKTRRWTEDILEGMQTVLNLDVYQPKP